MAAGLLRPAAAVCGCLCTPPLCAPPPKKGGRSARLVNPTAWARGAVFCQCQHCGVWHMLKADKSIVEEIRCVSSGRGGVSVWCMYA